MKNQNKQKTEYEITDPLSLQEIGDIIKTLDKKGEQVTYRAIAEKLDRSLSYVYNRVVLAQPTKPDLTKKLIDLPKGSRIIIADFAIEHSASRWAVYLAVQKMIKAGEMKKISNKWVRV